MYPLIWENVFGILKRAVTKGICSCKQWGSDLNNNYKIITNWIIEKTMNHIKPVIVEILYIKTYSRSPYITWPYA